MPSSKLCNRHLVQGFTTKKTRGQPGAKYPYQAPLVAPREQLAVAECTADRSQGSMKCRESKSTAPAPPLRVINPVASFRYSDFDLVLINKDVFEAQAGASQ